MWKKGHKSGRRRGKEGLPKVSATQKAQSPSVARVAAGWLGSLGVLPFG